MTITEFSAALNQLAAERGISVEVTLSAVEQAILAAYKKDYGEAEDLSVKIDPNTGEAKVFKEGEEVTPPGFGRIAAQTAKQVILQRIREEEKQAVLSEYEKKMGTITSGYIFRIEAGTVFLDLGKAQAVLPPSELIPGENYSHGQRLRVLVKQSKEGKKGPEILVSRSDPSFVKELFALEVPELAAGVVKIEVIAREAGSRTKVAVSSSEERVDPVGSCVGQKGVRVQAVTKELGEEKIDIIPYSSDPSRFIAASLSPAKVVKVDLKEKTKRAIVEVPDDQLSLAIGKEGQNVRLAAKLTGWKIDLKGAGKAFFAADEEALDLKRAGLSARVIKVLEKKGVKTLAQLKETAPDELKKIKGLGKKGLEEIAKSIGPSNM